MTLRIGQTLLPPPARQPFTLDQIPDGAIPTTGLICCLTHRRDATTGGWVVGWIREDYE